MNVITFNSLDSTTTLYGCGKCGIVQSPMTFGGDDAFTEELAEKCCKPVVCECGKECDRSYTACQRCRGIREAERDHAVFARAEKLKEDYEGPVYNPFTDEFFSDLGDLTDQQEDGDELPDYVHPCVTMRPSIDLDMLLEDAEEALEATDSFDIDWEGVEGLRNAISCFNACQTQEIWYPEYGKVVPVGGYNGAV